MKTLEKTYSKSDRIVAKAKFTYWVFALDVLVAAILGGVIAVVWVFNLQIEQIFAPGKSEVTILTDDNLKWALLGVGGFVLLFWAFHALSRWAKECILTEDKVIYQSGILSKECVTLQVIEVVTVETHQNMFQSILNVGTIYVIADAEHPYKIKGIVAPERFARRIMRQTSFVRKRDTNSGLSISVPKSK